MRRKAFSLGTGNKKLKSSLIWKHSVLEIPESGGGAAVGIVGLLIERAN